MELGRFSLLDSLSARQRVQKKTQQNQCIVRFPVPRQKQRRSSHVLPRSRAPARSERFDRWGGAVPSRESGTESKRARAYALVVGSGRLAGAPIRLPQTMFAPNLHRMGERQGRWVSRKSLAALLCVG